MPIMDRILQLARLGLFSGVLTLGLGGCTLISNQQTVDSSTNTNKSANTNSVVESAGLSSDQLALTLLAQTDISPLIDDARPLSIEFNGQLDTDLKNYDFYIAQRWQAGTNGTARFGEAVTRYTSATDAQTNLAELADGCTVATQRLVGDTDYICYTKPLVYYGGGDPEPAYMIYRFSTGIYGVRLDLVDSGDPLDDAQVIYDRLLATAHRLALLQQQHLAAALTNPPAVPPSAALNDLPGTLPGATLLGTTTLTPDQWRMLTADYTNPLTGFISGGVRRFHLTSRPNEVIEIIMIEFTDGAQAKALRDLLKQPGDTDVVLPADLSSTGGIGVVRDNLVELETVYDHYFIDVSVFAPLTDSDTTAGQADAITAMQATLASF